MEYCVKLQLKHHLRSYSVQIAMVILLLVVLFPVLCGVAVGNQYHYPGCRNTVKAVPNMGESCSAILCSHRYMPVCGSDGEEYQNDCILCKAACSNKSLYKSCDGFCPCGRGATRRHDVLVLEPTPGPGVVPSGFCLGKGSCP